MPYFIDDNDMLNADDPTGERVKRDLPPILYFAYCFGWGVGAGSGAIDDVRWHDPNRGGGVPTRVSRGPRCPSRGNARRIGAPRVRA